MLEAWQLGLLFLAAVAAGFVDSIAGGGGLITVPALLSAGLAPAQALGTNKLQATFGSFSAACHYAAAGTVPLRESVRGFILSLAGAAAGAIVVQRLDPDMLRRVIPILLLGAAACVWFKPRFGEEDVAPRLGRAPFDFLFGLGLGFYDGFFGPGTGTFWVMAFVMGLGYNLTRATGCTKVMNFASNLGALLLFIAGGQVVFVTGLVMGAGQFLGARLGARMAIRQGARIIRPMFLAVVLALTFKLLYDSLR